MRALFEGGYNSPSVGMKGGYNSRAGTIKGRVQLKVLRYLENMQIQYSFLKAKGSNFPQIPFAVSYISVSDGINYECHNT